MTPKAKIYKGKKISVVNVHGEKHLFISGEHIPTKAAGKGDAYWSAHFPYQEFDNLHDLGKAIVDYRAMDERKTGRQRKS